LQKQRVALEKFHAEKFAAATARAKGRRGPPAMADDDAPFEFEIFVSDRKAQESISQLFTDGDGEDTSSISVVDVNRKRTFGSFDLPFSVGIALSIPVGISTGIIANWLTEHMRKARQPKGVNSTIKFSFEDMLLSSVQANQR
jgi:hypothetical protein